MKHAEGIRRYTSIGEAVAAAMRRNAERAIERVDEKSRAGQRETVAGLPGPRSAREDGEIDR